jgi:hypothetical protein
MNELHYRLEALVNEHSEWQWFNSELEKASLSEQHQPEARMPRNWPLFDARLTDLNNLYPNEDWSRDLKRQMALWIEATRSPKPNAAQKVAGENAFVVFYHTCIMHFVEVDRNLKELSEQITAVAGNLNTLLTMIR